ncbi:MAG: hypothetical protein IRY91_02405 [Gemmatimonadaceae bacterium]|nr:hypothetical protein [Gemmatimonadaceae bacterium]
MRATWWVAWSGLAVALAVRPAHAQGSAAPSANGVDVAAYATVEQCLAAAARVRDSVERASPVWRDTLPDAVAVRDDSVPVAVVETARRCGARFAAGAAPLDGWRSLVTLDVLARWDARADTLVRRRLATVTTGAATERAWVIGTVLRAYLGVPFEGREDLVPPVRLAAAESLAAELDGLRGAPWTVRMEAMVRLMDAARRVGDTTRALRAAARVVAIADGLTAAERRTNLYNRRVRQDVYAALRLLHADALLDSLRRSTAAYVALQRSLYARAMGERPDAMRFPIGEPAPPIEGDFWFRRGDSAATRPTAGHVALVVFLDHGVDRNNRTASRCGVTVAGGSQRICWSGYARLRRLAQRFPGLEITLTAPTRGYFPFMSPPTPDVEAETLAHWWLDYHALPGALAVTRTAWWRLPDPDRRRIDRDDGANVEHYSFGERGAITTFSVFLVDPGGTIVDAEDWSGAPTSDSARALADEHYLGRMIDILLARSTRANR